MHCYVDGGPAPAMTLEDFQFCAEKLCPVLRKLRGNAAITLGNEMFCNPRIADILRTCKEQLPGHISYRNFMIPTTGLALFARKDADEIISELQALGAPGFMLAIHGDRDIHNRIVDNPRAFDDLFHFADYLSANGFGILFNLIVSKSLANDIQTITDRVSAYESKVRFTVPLYVPTMRMRKYQALRADYTGCMKITEIGNLVGISTVQLNEHCRIHSESAVYDDLLQNGFSYEAEKKHSPAWAFFNITQNLDFYYGNVGAHTQYLGNLKEMDTDEILSAILSVGPNYDWDAFYDDSIFERLTDMIIQMGPPISNFVYPTKADCIYAWLDSLGIKSKLLSTSGRCHHG
jgi:hypothetical protein